MAIELTKKENMVSSGLYEKYRVFEGFVELNCSTKEGLTVDLAHMTAHGEILIKPCLTIADARNRLNFRIPGNDRFKLDLARLL